MFLLLAFSFTSYGQSNVTKKCKTCSKSIKECRYNGKHPSKTQQKKPVGPTAASSRGIPAKTPKKGSDKGSPEKPKSGNDTQTVNVPTRTGADDPYPFRRVGTCPLTDNLNPLDGGIILGWTTMEEAVSAGGTLGGDKKYVRLEGRAYYDHQMDGIIESLYFTHGDGIPKTWGKAGLSFEMSYDQWMRWLRTHNYTIVVGEEPTYKSTYFSAEIHAYNIQNDLYFELDFDYQSGTCYSSNTLYSITLTRNHRIRTRTTDYGPYSYVNGIKCTFVTISNLQARGMELGENRATDGDYSFYLIPSIIPGNNKEHVYLNDTVYKVSIYDKSAQYLPYGWDGDGVMTYEKWMAYFNRKGFIVTEDEVRGNSSTSAKYPKVTATHPYWGIIIDLSFEQSTLSSSRTAMYYDIKYF